MSSAPASSPSKDSKEKRRAKRRPILDTFSLFAVVPKKGVYRLPIHDISELGIGLDLDIEGESSELFAVQPQEKLDIHVYLNQSLYLSLQVTVIRLEERKGVRLLGAEFADRSTPSYKAYAAFLQMLDLLAEAAQIQAG